MPLVPASQKTSLKRVGTTKTERTVREKCNIWNFESMEDSMVIAKLPAHCPKTKRSRGTTNSLNHGSICVGSNVVSINIVRLVLGDTVGCAVVKSDIIGVNIKIDKHEWE